jgi:hypothetical protein
VASGWSTPTAINPVSVGTVVVTVTVVSTVAVEDTVSVVVI